MCEQCQQPTPDRDTLLREHAILVAECGILRMHLAAIAMGKHPDPVQHAKTILLLTSEPLQAVREGCPDSPIDWAGVTGSDSKKNLVVSDDPY